MSPSMKETRAALIDAARIAAYIQKQELDWGIQELPSKYGEQGSADVVTYADVRTEQALRSFFSRHLPEYSIIGEECGAQNSNNGKIITLDPLDGTKSFKARLPCFGPAIGVYHYGTNVAGIEYNVLRDTMYVATEETGLERIGNSYGDERRMVIFIGGDIKQSARFPEFLHKVQMCLAEYRVLAYEQDVLTKTLVCDGKLAGFFHAGLARHDIGATPLFCRFSGTCLTDLHGHNYDFLDETSVVEMYNTGKKKIIYSCPIVIAKPGLHGRFLSALQDNYSCFE